ncbi:MAG TPA: acyl-CoA dehydrogenase family protein [Gaiellaceae bacterium]|nr:acyl-CoA dehydrogenase family protein [Gaiellaceae bacterium]
MIGFQPSHEQRELQRLARAFAERELRPISREWDEREDFRRTCSRRPRGPD